MLGADLNLTCVAVGAPMPFVKWRKGLAQDLTPEDKLPIGKNVLELTNIQESANYTCIAASNLGVIETVAMVKVQCKFNKKHILNNFQTRNTYYYCSITRSTNKCKRIRNHGNVSSLDVDIQFTR